MPRQSPSSLLLSTPLTIIKLDRQLARNLGKDEDEVVRHLRQRLGVLIIRDNAMMMASRHPTFAPPEIDGDED